MDFKKSKYDANHIIGVYNLKLNHQCAYLDQLTALTNGMYRFDANDPELEKLRKRLERKGSFFNEEELKMRFLAFLFEFADIEVEGKLEIFFERTLTTELQNEKQTIKCDCLFASPFGIYEPKLPYFFLQEFKKQKQQDDAEGQMLLGMLIAQNLNKNSMPVYGCWIQGKNWVFTTLHEDNYCVSRQYDVVQAHDLYNVINILQNFKHIILAQIEA